jgi:tRNA1Val (adenine37-N6)-methyltransferase
MSEQILAHAVFRFKQFEIRQDQCNMKVNTDGVLLGAWSDVTGKKRALDVGSGTGVIAIMLAQRNDSMHVTGIEIDPASYSQSRENMKSSQFADRLDVLNMAVQDFSRECTEKYDLVISNPPFFTGGTFSYNENKANVRHTLKLSHSDLLLSVKRVISPDGHFDVILPYIEGLRFVEIAEKYDFYIEKMTCVKSRENKNTERLLLRFSTNKQVQLQKDELIIHNGPGPKDYSSQFVDLTKEFYTFM